MAPIPEKWFNPNQRKKVYPRCILAKYILTRPNNLNIPHSLNVHCLFLIVHLQNTPHQAAQTWQIKKTQETTVEPEMWSLLNHQNLILVHSLDHLCIGVESRMPQQQITWHGTRDMAHVTWITWHESGTLHETGITWHWSHGAWLVSVFEITFSVVYVKLHCRRTHLQKSIGQ